MNKNYSKHLADNFQYALYDLTLRKSNKYSYFFDTTFNDFMKLRVDGGIVLTVPTYELLKPIEECLSDSLYQMLKQKARSSRRIPYREIREFLIKEGSIKEKKSFDIKLKDFDLHFSYYKSPKSGSHLCREDYVSGISLNACTDEEILDRVEGMSNNLSFYLGIETSYYMRVEDIFQQYNRSDLFIHIVESLMLVVNERYSKELEEERQRPKQPIPLVFGGYNHNGRHIVVDEWGNELHRY